MDLVTLGLGIGTIAVIPLGAAVKKSYDNEHRITKLEADSQNTILRLASIDSKLDRLIERFLPNG